MIILSVKSKSSLIKIETMLKLPSSIVTILPIQNILVIILIFASVTILPSEVNLLYLRIEEKIELNFIFSFCVKAATIKYIPYKKGKAEIKLSHGIEKNDKTITAKDNTIKIEELINFF